MVTSIIRIIEQLLLYLPLVSGSYISLSLMQVPDLSLETAFVFGAITATTALTIAAQQPPVLLLTLVLLASAIGGMLVGAVSSSMVNYGKLPPLLATILTIGIFHGISIITLHGASFRSLTQLPNPLTLLPTIAGKPELGALLLVNVLMLGFLSYLLCSQLGFSLCIYGNNPRFFSFFHQSKEYIYTAGLMIANACAGISGYLFAQINGFVEINMGFGMVLLCITALILGKAVISSRYARITIPLLGILLYVTLQQLLLRAGITAHYFTMLQATIVLLMLLYRYQKHTVTDQQQLGV